MADDFSELAALTADLTGAANGADISRNVDKALKFTSVEMKRDWRQGAERSGLRGYAASIDFDIKYAPGEISSEIGPNLGRNQGSFGFVEDAPGDVRSAPQHAGRNALEANEPDFYRGLEIAAFDALTKAVSK
jgi:hypothetical protein